MTLWKFGILRVAYVFLRIWKGKEVLFKKEAKNFF